MTPRIYLLPTLAAIASLAYFFLTSSSTLPPARAVESVLLEAHHAFERRDPEALAQLLSPHVDPPRRTALMAYVAQVMAVPGWRGVLIAQQQLDVRDDDTVVAEVDAALVPSDAPSRTGLANALKGNLGFVRLQVRFVREAGDVWRARDVTWSSLTLL